MSRFPVSEGTKRPFRLWNSTTNKAMRWRCYKHRQNAHIGALIEARWSKVGVTIEVYDAATGRLAGQYTRLAKTIAFTRG